MVPMGEKTNAVLVRKSEGKKPLERFRRRWKDTIRMDIKETDYTPCQWYYNNTQHTN